MNSARSNITNILHITKLLVTNTKKCNAYLSNKNNNLIDDQLPFLHYDYQPYMKFKSHLCRNKSVQEIQLYHKKNTMFSFIKRDANAEYKKKSKGKKRNMSASVINSASTTAMTFYSNKNNLSAMKVMRIINDYLIDDNTREDHINMAYNENEIFNKPSYYDQIILDSIEQLKSRENSNDARNYARVINKGKINETVLQLRSIHIKYTNTFTNDFCEYDLPLGFLPLFYHNPKENIILLLLVMTKFNKDYKSVIIDENAIYNLICNSSTYASENKPKSLTSRQKEKKPQKLQQRFSQQPQQKLQFMDSARRKTKIDGHHPKSKFPSKQSIDFISTDEYEIKKQTYALIKKKNIYPDNYDDGTKDNNKKNKVTKPINVYKYIWMTPVNTFSIEIIMPQLSIQFSEFHTEVTKFIDPELLFYLYERDFSKWDFYALHYFYSYKSFRNLLDSITSKISNTDGFSNKHLSINQLKVKDFSDKDYEWQCCMTNKNQENCLVNLKLLNLEMNLKSPVLTIDKLYEMEVFHFNFSFKQSFFMALAAQKIDLFDFLIKFSSITSDNIFSFDYDKFDSFNDNKILLFQQNVNSSHRDKIFNNQEKEKLEINLNKGKITISKIINQRYLFEVESDNEKEIPLEIIEMMSKVSCVKWDVLLKELLLSDPIPDPNDDLNNSRGHESPNFNSNRDFKKRSNPFI